MRGTDTKNRIIGAAFALFAERGYHAVSVRDIAAAVHIKDASLYNHFPSKQDIFDAVLAQEIERTRKVFAGQGVMFAPTEDPAGYVGAYAETERRVLDGFRYFFEDEGMVRLRHLLTISQFESDSAARAYRFIFLDQPMAIQQAVFERLIADGQYAPDDAATLAREFYGPVFILLTSNVAWQKAAPLIKGHLRRFFASHMREEVPESPKTKETL